MRRGVLALVALLVVAPARAAAQRWGETIDGVQSPFKHAAPAMTSGQNCTKEFPDSLWLGAGNATASHVVAVGGSPITWATDTIGARVAYARCEAPDPRRRPWRYPADVLLDVGGTFVVWSARSADSAFVMEPLLRRGTDRELQPMGWVVGRIGTASAVTQMAGATADGQHAQQERDRSALLADYQRRQAELRKRGWSEDTIRSVLNQQASVGMNAEMVRAALGAPKTVNTTLTAGGRREQWVYPHEYVYLENGFVTAVQITP
jgi:hypothetical protein